MIIAIAQRLGVHPAAVCVVWSVRRGQVPIPFSTRRANDLANLRGAVDNRLNDDAGRGPAGQQHGGVP